MVYLTNHYHSLNQHGMKAKEAYFRYIRHANQYSYTRRIMQIRRRSIALDLVSDCAHGLILGLALWIRGSVSPDLYLH